MIDDFLLRALIAGAVIALAAAPLGCLVVWRRMAYFGDATGHAGLVWHISVMRRGMLACWVWHLGWRLAYR